jgi:hypothetical protein
MKSMKLSALAVGLLLGCLFFMTVQSFANAEPTLLPAALAAQEQNSPKIFNAKVKGGKILILGENFGPGTVVLINGREVKTNLDSESPTTMLVAKKITKVAEIGTEVNLEIKISNGQTSDPFAIFLGRSIAIADNLQTITLAVGEKVILQLKKEPYEWTPTVINPNVLEKVQEADMPGSQGIYQAKGTGSTQLNAIGEIPCNKAERPCLPSAAELFTVNIVVAQ